MIDFLVSIPAILCRAEMREFNPYVTIRAAYAARHDFSADGIMVDALNTTINQFDSATQAVIGEQENKKQPASA